MVCLRLLLVFVPGSLSTSSFPVQSTGLVLVRSIGRVRRTSSCDDADYLTSVMSGSLNFATHSGTVGDAMRPNRATKARKRGTACA